MQIMYYGIFAIFTICCSVSNVIVDILKQENIPFHPSSLVAYCEISKFLITAICACVCKNTEIYKSCQDQPLTILKLSIPSLCYVVQNNLSYYAILATSAPTFQLWSNMKLLTTAMFMSILLQTRISCHKFLCLLQIICGLTITHMHKSFTWEFGISYILILSVVSGFSSTYTELLLKDSSLSFLTKTFYMYLFSALFSFPFYTYQELNNTYLSIMLCLNIVSGMSVSLIMKYSNNMVKIFLTFFSLMISAVLSSMCCSFRISKTFIVSSLIVCIAIFQYNSKEHEDTVTVDENIELQEEKQPII